VKVIYKNRFYRDLANLKNFEVAEEAEQALDELETVTNISQISNLKKLIGYKDAYRIRISDYRTGSYIQNNVAEVAAVMQRKDIYKHFP